MSDDIKTYSTQISLSKIEAQIVRTIEPLDEDDESGGRSDLADIAHANLCGALKEIRRGKWIVKGRNIDGMCYYNKGAWRNAWYEGETFDTQDAAQKVIYVLYANNRNKSPDEVTGQLKAGQI